MLVLCKITRFKSGHEFSACPNPLVISLYYMSGNNMELLTSADPCTIPCAEKVQHDDDDMQRMQFAFRYCRYNMHYFITQLECYSSHKAQS